jgi:aminoglycoside phosphotransferase (APT) family kinase protein
VDDLNKSLQAAQQVSDGSSKALQQLTGRAETVAQRLVLMMASMHDIDEADAAAPAPEPAAEDEEMAAAYEAEAEPAEEKQEESKPSGLMFVRHNRSQNRVA